MTTLESPSKVVSVVIIRKITYSLQSLKGVLNLPEFHENPFDSSPRWVPSTSSN